MTEPQRELPAGAWWIQLLGWGAALSVLAIALAGGLAAVIDPVPGLAAVGMFGLVLLAATALLGWLLGLLAKLVDARHYGGLGHVGSDPLEVGAVVVYVWLYPLLVAFSLRAGLDGVYRERNPGLAGAGIASWGLIAIAAIAIALGQG